MKHNEDCNVRMLEFLVDDLSVEFAGNIYQQTVGIPLGTTCAPLLADLSLYCMRPSSFKNS